MLLLFFCLIFYASADDICPQVTPVTPYNLEKVCVYSIISLKAFRFEGKKAGGCFIRNTWTIDTKYTTGRWFEVASYSSHDDGTKDPACVYYDEHPDYQDFNFTGFEVINNTKKIYRGISWYPPGVKNVGIILETVDINGEPDYLQYFILDIDYDKYALLYVCEFYEKTKEKEEYVWLLSRTLEVKEESKKAMNEFFSSQKHLDASKIDWHDNTLKSCLLD